MFFLTFGGSGEVSDLLKEASSGNTDARERLISNNLIFIKKIVSKKIAVYEDIEKRDEYSVALMAFNEAIDRYRPGLRSFHSFAASVIQKRIIDYYRSQKKHLGQKHFENGEDMEIPGEGGSPFDQVSAKMEMEIFIKQLSEYKITLRDLIEQTPKHYDSRIMCARIAMAVTGDEVMGAHFKKYRTIPLKKLIEKVKVNPKTVERHRKYIIGICLVLLSDLDTMREYVVRMAGDGGKNA